MKKFIVIIALISLVLVACQGETELEVSDDILYPEATINIVDLDNNEVEITLEELVEVGESNFVATKDTSSTEPEEFDYTGILLKNIFEELEINYDGIAGVVVSAEDGYKVTIEADKIQEDDNVYLAYKSEGKWLENKDNDGDGPLQLIVSNDQFSQYWCKYVKTIELIK
ncbi:MAG: molybdopterin-dependent oxidoreductase [Clostridia bacterium]